MKISAENHPPSASCKTSTGKFTMENLFIGKNIIRLDRVDSTNNYAVGLIRGSRENPALKVFDGTIVSAKFQEQGKGQRGNSWESDAGKNLTFSIVLKPAFLPAGRQFLLNKIISLAILDFLKDCGIKQVAIKWPNDVLAEGKKIAGILIENIIQSNTIQYSVVGIGLNINQEKFTSTQAATSLKILSGKSYSLEENLLKLASFIEGRYLKLKNDLLSCENDYLNSLYRFNEWNKFNLKGTPANARISGVAEDGRLILQQENGIENHYDIKEVIFL